MRAALLAILLAAVPAFAHKGDGAFTDQGPSGAHHRFEVGSHNSIFEKYARSAA